jgi:eukaryotic-like serine/threonine-protein kinase
MVAQSVSHYEILEPIGEGGMGVVYRARDTRLDRDVALKFLRVGPDPSGTAKARFAAEARAASMLDHPSICPVYDIGEAPDGSQFIAMAYCSGRTLEQRLREEGVTVEEAVSISQQVADGLAAAHANGIIHRDVKPGNVIVADDGRARIVDFGVAKLADAGITQAGMMVGTVAYMAPEQIHGADSDARTDVWSFGVLLYQMLTRRLPFTASYDQAMAYRILHEDPDPLEVDLPKEYRELEELIADCLEKDPDLRPASMEEVAARLEFRDPAGTRPFRLALPRRMARRAPGIYRTIGVAAFSLVLVLGLSFWFITQPGVLPAEKGVVVLPITALGGTHEDQLLADGLTAQLTNKLAQLVPYTEGAFWVTPHSVVLDRDVHSPSAARRTLDASLVVEGTLVRTPTRLRLSFNLIDTRTLRTIDADDVVLAPHEIDRLQEEAARRVVAMMQVQLAPASDAALTAGRTSDPQAYEYFLRGLAFLERFDRGENLSAAMELLEQAIERDPLYASAIAVLGRAKWELYESTQDELYLSLAQRDLEHALSIDPNLTRARVMIARVYSETGRVTDALSEIERIIAQQPGNGDAYRVYGHALEKAGRPEEAEGAFRRAISLQPSDWAGYNDLSRFFYRRGRYEDSAAQAMEVIRITPDNARGYSNLGAAYWALGRRDDARANLERSIEIAPTARAFSNLATFHYHTGDMERAAENYREALNLQDSNYEFWRNLAATYRELGRRDEQHTAHQEAIRRAERHVQLRPDDHSAMAELAGMYIEVGNENRGRALLRTLSTRQIMNVNVLYSVAESHELLGERREALDWLCRAAGAGYSLPTIEQAPALASLRTDPAYSRIPECAASP